MSTAQDLRTAAINDTGRNLDLAASHVAYAFVGATEWPECLDSLGHRTFLLIVAEALDYREPMSSITEDVSRAYWTSNLAAVVRAVERQHGIGESR